MAAVDASDAAACFSAWLDRVAMGERITIVSGGRLVPVLQAPDTVREAVEGIRALSDRLPESEVSWKSLRDGGRKR